MDYGTGAIFGCPAHDQRDLDFARKYDCEVTPVVLPKDQDKQSFTIENEAYTGPGTLINSGDWDGLSVEEGKKIAIQALKPWAVDMPRPLIAFVIGVCLVKDIGDAQSRLFIVMIAGRPCA